MNDERGFTLIELLVVLAIMGILMGITALSLGGLTSSSKEMAMKSEKEQVQTAIDVYETQRTIGAACCTNTISSQITPSLQVGPTGVVSNTFGQFLRRDTKYYYKWSDNGVPITVCDTADCTGIHYP